MLRNERCVYGSEDALYAALAAAAPIQRLATTITIHAAGETVWTGVRYHAPEKTVYIELPAPAAQTAQSDDAGADGMRLDKLREESWDLRSFCIGEEDVGWRIVEFHQAAPHERVVAEVFKDDPRAAIDAATDQARKGGM